MKSHPSLTPSGYWWLFREEESVLLRDVAPDALPGTGGWVGGPHWGRGSREWVWSNTLYILQPSLLIPSFVSLANNSASLSLETH